MVWRREWRVLEWRHTLAIVGVVSIVAIVGVVALMAMVALTAPAVQVEPIAPAVQVAGQTTPAVPATETGDIRPGPDTLFMAAATIMAFAVFGSALSMRIERKPKKPDWMWRARVLSPLSVLPLIGIQTWFMQRLAAGDNVYSASVWGLQPTGVLAFPPSVVLWIFATTLSDRDFGLCDCWEELFRQQEGRC